MKQHQKLSKCFILLYSNTQAHTSPTDNNTNTNNTYKPATKKKQSNHNMFLLYTKGLIESLNICGNAVIQVHF